MRNKVLVLYGSYPNDWQGIRFVRYLTSEFVTCGADPVLVDARSYGLPILDRMYKEFPDGQAPAPLEKLADLIRKADAFVFVTGEYNWGVQPGLKNLADHFLEEWFSRPAAIACYSAGCLADAHAGLVWIGILSEMGMIVTGSRLTVGRVAEAFDTDGLPTGDAGASVVRAFPQFADDLAWWAKAARAQRAKVEPFLSPSDIPLSLCSEARSTVARAGRHLAEVADAYRAVPRRDNRWPM